MLHYRIISICLFLFLAAQVQAQQGVNQVLRQVAANNKTLQAAEYYRDAQQLKYRTGLNPENPFVEYDYLNGSPADAGNQVEFSVTQRIDFPSAYGKRRRVASLQTGQADYQLAVERQNILLEAQQSALQLIYLNRQASELKKRYEAINTLYQRFQKSTRAGDGNILDENKARIRLLDIRTSLQKNEAERRKMAEKLTELNGGQPITLVDTLYAGIPAIPDFEILDSLVEASDPRLKVLEQQLAVEETKIDLTRALTLPKLEGGYRYQGILGQTYQGIHLGISVPLWELKNTVKTQQAYSQFAQARLDAERVSHRQEIKQYYEEYQALQEALKDYQTLLGKSDNLRVLEKALRLGEISAVEYFMELSFYYDAYDSYLQLEVESQQAATQLLKYAL